MSIEIQDAKISFVSLVDLAANKHRFLIAKSKNKNQIDFSTYGKIIKTEQDTHHITGIVYAPLEEDAHNNYMTAEEIQKAAFWFAKNGNKIDLQHNFQQCTSCTVVETWIAKADHTIENQPISKGTWLITVEVSDNDIWDKINKKEITGFSMGGVGKYSDIQTDISNIKKEDDIVLDNNDIINKTLTTGSVSSGLLNPEQSRKFIKQVMDNTSLSGLVRVEMRKSKTGEIDKIGIDRRLVRKKTEDTDDNYRGKPIFSKVEYSTVAVRLPWEITEETLRENIEGQGLEATITSLMAQAVGLDMEDLWLNADKDIPETFEDAQNNSSPTPDYNFLSINDGWLKKLLKGPHIVDRSTVNNGKLTLDVWNDALLEMPNKYNNGKLRWLMSPRRKQAWETYLLDKALSAGGIITDRRIENPYAIPVIPVTSMPDDKVILTDPKNLVVVNTYDVKIRKTTEGKEAVMHDKRFYVIHLDYDSIIEEMDAAVLIDGLAPII